MRLATQTPYIKAYTGSGSPLTERDINANCSLCAGTGSDWKEKEKSRGYSSPYNNRVPDKDLDNTYDLACCGGKVHGISIFRMNSGISGQGAFEYVMTYGWLIIILIVIGSTLWYLGIFDVEEKVAISSGFSKIRPLDPSILLTPDGNFSGVFVNGAGYSVNITNITILNLVGPPRKKCNLTEGTGNKQAGEAFSVKANDCVGSLKGEGEPYTLNVNISHTEVVGGTPISRQERGTIYGFYEFYITTTSITTTTSTSTSTSSSTSTSTSTSSSTTSSSTTSTTSIPSISVLICGTFYNCGDPDDICPGNYGVTCSPTDPNC